MSTLNLDFLVDVMTPLVAIVAIIVTQRSNDKVLKRQILSLKENSITTLYYPLIFKLEELNVIFEVKADAISKEDFRSVDFQDAYKLIMEKNTEIVKFIERSNHFWTISGDINDSIFNYIKTVYYIDSITDKKTKATIIKDKELKEIVCDLTGTIKSAIEALNKKAAKCR